MENESTQLWEEHVATIQASADAVLVDAAIRALSPLIVETAERVCRGRMVRLQIQSDFIAGSVSELIAPRAPHNRRPGASRIAKYDPKDGPFPGWLKTVLDNLLLDHLKAANRRGAHEKPFSFVEDGPDAGQSIPDLRSLKSDDELDRNALFTECDLKRIEAWPVMDRLLWLTVFDLQRKVRASDWQAWCSEAGLPSPFPPQPDLPRERGDWINLVAEFLSASPNALQNRLRRRLEQLRLEPLDYIRGIQHDQ